jgi:uncharacterized protein (DUF983 family)
MSEPSKILGPDGKRPARAAVSDDCPKCQAGPEKRVLSGGFGEPHDVCSKCGHDFQERTV